jgi:hypothetical protein
MDPELLRERLHESVNSLLDEFVRDSAPPRSGGFGAAVVVEDDGRGDDFSYVWPSGVREEFELVRRYRVDDSVATRRVIVGWTDREAWGRLRRRAVVFFARNERDQPQRWYPLTQFVETDEYPTYAATIPDPDQPRALLREGDDVPETFRENAMPAESLFKSVRAGSSLRLVVGEDDDKDMVLHGYWVARLRNRF